MNILFCLKAIFILLKIKQTHGYCLSIVRINFFKFKKSIQYAKEGSWDKCAPEILDSRWAKQTPKRAGRYSVRLAALAIPV